MPTRRSSDSTGWGNPEQAFPKGKVIVRDITNAQEVSRNTYTFDLTKNPKWITVTVVDKVTELRPGIFRVVGEELHLSQAVGGGARPTNFVDGSYSIMKRQTAKKDQL